MYEINRTELSEASDNSNGHLKKVSYNGIHYKLNATTMNKSKEQDTNFEDRKYGATGSRYYPMKNDNVHRSNSSLELLDPAESNLLKFVGPLRREYGSHGSIDIISDRLPLAKKSEFYFDILQPTNVKNNKIETQNAHVSSLINTYDDQIDRGISSPKLRMRLKLWGQTKSNPKPQANIEDQSIAFSNVSSSTASVSFADIEERTRRRTFAHYDCQSLTANLGYAAKLRGLLLARRRNTTTGASAAAMHSTRSSTPDGDATEEDFGDGMCNELLENCPFFRNEIGGETEREVSLTRSEQLPAIKKNKRDIHRPMISYGVSILECPVGETLWKQTCPYQPMLNLIEQTDSGAHYYRKYFFRQEHQNWIGIDEQLGPVAISIKKERPVHQPISSDPSHPQHLYRLIVRTSELLTLRGSIFEDSVPNLRGAGKTVNTKDLLDYIAPEIQSTCLRLAVNSTQCEEQLLKLDEQGLTNKYKVGVLYCRAGQSTEEDMYNNEDAGPAFNEFLETIGKKVRLKGFDFYKAGLDNKTDSTGTHSVYTTFQDCEIMFHVSSMLPFTPNNRQQLLRKRHIGNDIVTIVFQEPGAAPFSPKNIRSQFQHVFIIVQVVNPCKHNTCYRVAVSRSKEVPVFGPPIRESGFYQKNKNFTNMLLAKIINAENAAHRSEKFVIMATRTRQEYLKDLCNNYCSQTMVDTGQKLKIFPTKKKEPTKPRYNGDASQRGAFCWQVILHDSGQSTQTDCFLGISAETFVLIEESSRQIIFTIPNRLILGWSTNNNALRVYHHQGECITMHMRESGDRDEQLEVIERLRAVTNGCGALELILRRNSMGQLGFHVQPDGVVTQVEINGQAWIAGLRQGYRLVEICKIAVATLSHDQMVDLLKTSAQVTVTVIESFSDFSPRRGCFFQNCKINAMNYKYDNISSNQNNPPQHQISPLKHYQQYVRNFSPPRSSNSSGYGTGSSSKSFLNEEGKVLSEIRISSVNSSKNDEKWYDTVAEQNYTKATNNIQMDSNKTNIASTLSNALITQGQNYVQCPPKSNEMTNDYSSPKRVIENRSINEENRNDIDTQQAKAIYSVPKKVAHKQLSYSEDENIISKPTEVSQLKKSATTNNICTSKKTSTASVLPSSSSSSRNNSPRTLIETKLRSGTRNPFSSQHRSSIHSSSTLQKDLLKLISPEYLTAPSDDNFHELDLPNTIMKQQRTSTNSHSLGNLHTYNSSPVKSDLLSDDTILMKSNFNMKEEIKNDLSNGVNSNYKHYKPFYPSAGKEIVTTARPATVVPSSNSIYSDDLIKTYELLHVKEIENDSKNPKMESLNKGESSGDAKEDILWSNLAESVRKHVILHFKNETSVKVKTNLFFLQ